MPPIIKHKNFILSAVSDCRALYRHCLSPRGAHTNAGVEAAFLQMYKSWESFLELCTLSFMCGRLRCDGHVVLCNTLSQDEESARKIIYQERPYLEWTNIDTVIYRLEKIFTQANPLVNSIRPIKSELSQMTVLRNAIAHSSQISKEKLYKIIQGQIGGQPRIKRPAEFLSYPYVNDPSRTYFDRYADVLEVTAQGITG